MNEADIPVLSIGARLGGTDPESNEWDSAISRLMRQVMAARAGVVSPLRVNVVFFVRGDILPSLDFAGVRTGRFSRKDAHLMVQAAVPAGYVDDRGHVLIELLRAAIDEAETFARRRRVADDLHELHGVVRGLG